MMLSYRNYNVQITDDPNYTPGSDDNITQYHQVYSYDNGYRQSAHALRVYQDNVELASAIVLGAAGGTTVHPKSTLIIEDQILVCCGNQIFALQLPSLIKNWNVEADWATCFGLHLIGDAIIVHGECSICRLDSTGNISWEFSGADIFVHAHKNSFEIIGDTIVLTDWEDNVYYLDATGKQLNSWNI